MISDFPVLKKRLNDLGMLLIKDQIQKSSPMLSTMNQSTVSEGDKLGILRENGEFEVSEFKLFEAVTTLSTDEFESLNEEQIYKNIYLPLAHQLSEQMSKAVLEKIDEAVSKTGNIIESPDGLTHEWILKALGKMSINFIDDNIEKPVAMSIQASPEMIEKYKNYSKNLTDTEKECFSKDYKELLDMKYEEFLSDLNCRQLTD